MSAGRLIVYRARTHLARARTFHVDVDGSERGTVRGSQRLDIACDVGVHTVAVRIGSERTDEIAVDIVAGEATFVVIDFDATADDANTSRLGMVVRATDGQRPRASAARASRPSIGNPRSPVEQAFYVLGFVLLLAGLVLSKTVGQAAASGPQIVGLVIIVVLFFRRLRYKGD